MWVVSLLYVCEWRTCVSGVCVRVMYVWLVYERAMCVRHVYARVERERLLSICMCDVCEWCGKYMRGDWAVRDG